MKHCVFRYLFTVIATFHVAFLSGLRAQDISSRLVAEFRFDGTTSDSSPNRFPLSQTGGGIRYVPDRFGLANRAIEFLFPPASADYLTGSGPSLANKSSSIAFWLRKNYVGNGSNGSWMFSIGDLVGASGKNMHIALDYGAPIRYAPFYDGFDINNVLYVGTWYHLAFTDDYENKIRRIFINGVQVASKVVSIPFSGGNLMRFSLADVTLDDFRIYDRALSAQDVAALAAYQAPLEPAPMITTQPSAQTVAVGGSATFSVVATGSGPLSYQWSKDGVPLAGATAATYGRASVQATRIGDYTVLVSGGTSSVTSSPARLSIAGVSSSLWLGLVAYFPFDANGNDQSGFGNHATVAGNAQFLSSGASGGALRLVGDSSLYYAGGGHALLPRFGTYLNSGFTVSFWVKDESLINNWAIHEQSYITFGPLDYPQVDIALNSETQKLRFIVDGGSPTTRTEITTPMPFATTLSSWKHIVLSYAPGKWAAYLNGTKIDERTVTASIFPAATAGLGRGWWSAGSASAARMSATYDNLRVYSRALAESDVAQLYASELPVAPLLAPSLVTQPLGETIRVGQGLTLSAVATGTAPFSYQWLKDGVAIAGATGASFSVGSVAYGDAGRYTVVISNSVGSTVSAPAVLTVIPDTYAPTISNQPIAMTAIFGSSVALSVAASANPAPSYQWLRNGASVAGATSSILTLAPVAREQAGVYSVVISNSVGSVVSSGAPLSVVTGSALSNLSVRTSMSAGQTLIVGGVINGGTKTILVRGGGPALNGFGLAGMPDPRLELYFPGVLFPVAANDDWPASLAGTFQSVGAFPFTVGSKDAALRQDLNGAFSVQARGIGAGSIIVEAYDVSGGLATRMVNVSARSRVGTGGDILIAGLAVLGTGTKQVLVRGVGPTLAAFGVVDTLADPRLEVFDSTGRSIGSNDDWSPTLAATFNQVGAFPLSVGSKDAALVLILSAGQTYSVQVSGVGGTSGEAIIEVYEVF